MSGPHNFQRVCGGGEAHDSVLGKSSTEYGDRRNNEAESPYGRPQLLAARVTLERKDSVVGKSHRKDPSAAAEPG